MSDKENASDGSQEGKRPSRRKHDDADIAIGSQTERTLPYEEPSSSNKQPSSPLVLRSIDLAAIQSPSPGADDKHDFTFTRPKSADAKLQSTSSAATAPTPRFKTSCRKTLGLSSDQRMPLGHESYDSRQPKIRQSKLRQNASTFRQKENSYSQGSTEASQKEGWPSQAHTSKYMHPRDAYQPAYEFTSDHSDAYPYQQNQDPAYYPGYNWESYPSFAYSQQDYPDSRTYPGYDWSSTHSFAYPEQQFQGTYYSTDPYGQSYTPSSQYSPHAYYQTSQPYYQFDASSNQFGQYTYAPQYYNGVYYQPYYYHPANTMPTYAAYQGYQSGTAYTPYQSQAWTYGDSYPQGFYWDQAYNPAFAGNPNYNPYPQASSEWGGQEFTWQDTRGQRQKNWRSRSRCSKFDNMSPRRMTSFCFQAHSKGLRPTSRIPKQAIRRLVQHQLETRQPVHAPWYRSAPQPRTSSGKPRRSDGAIKVGTGTGVWIPPLKLS